MTDDPILLALTREREALTIELRSLATDLDGIDRELADRAWRRDRIPGRVMSDLEAERVRLTAQLRRSAARLCLLDRRLAAARTPGAVH